MRRTMVLSLTLLLALAGCAAPGGDDEREDDDVEPTPTPIFTTPEPTPTPTGATTTPAPTPAPVLDSSTYALATSGIPGQALPGAAFSFTLFANGSVTTSSDHIGAHFADNDTANPPVTPGRSDCDHQSGSLPGTFNVSCAIASEGSWYVWGHARVNDSGEVRNWWSPTASLVKVRDYALNASGFPTNPPTSKSNFTFMLTINGTDNTTSDHLGAHFWNATTADPTVANSAGACAHVNTTGVVGTFSVTCNIEHASIGPKDFFVRGHLRITESGTALNWWSDEVKVSIVGVPPSPLP